jgi:hypothetical protein
MDFREMEELISEWKPSFTQRVKGAFDAAKQNWGQSGKSTLTNPHTQGEPSGGVDMHQVELDTREIQSVIQRLKSPQVKKFMTQVFEKLNDWGREMYMKQK